jgi:trigger factor
VSGGRLGLLDPKALGDLLAPKRVELPLIEAPSLEGLDVTVSRARPITMEDVAERLSELARQLAHRRDRKQGDQVQAGDDICVDTLGYSGGKLIPFSIRESRWTVVAPLHELPGLFEQLVGVRVGESVTREIVLPPDYPTEAFRNAKAIYLVDVVAAREVEALDPAGAEFIKRLGRGPSLEVAAQAVMQDLLQERLAEVDLAGVHAVLDVLVSRAKVEVPQDVIDNALVTLWSKAEAPILARKNFGAQEQKEAMQAWVNDPASRADVAHRVAVSAVLHAVAERDGVNPNPENLKPLAYAAGEAVGFPKAELDKVPDWELTEPYKSNARYVLTVDHIMKRARVVTK